MSLTTQGFLKNRDPRISSTADGLVLTCIDYRFLDEIPKYLHTQAPGDTFDHAILAGASLGLFSGVYPNWATTFWDHLEVSIALHQIRTVYILDHRDCGAYREFYALPPRPADNSPDLPNYLAMETAIHQHYMDRLKSLILKAHSSLNVVCHLLDVP